MKTVAWLAFIIAIIALILGWVAFNRSGVNLEAIIEQEVEEAELRIRADLDQARNVMEEEVEDVMEEDDSATTTDDTL